MFLLTTLASLAFAAELTQQTAEPEPVIGMAKVVGYSRDPLARSPLPPITHSRAILDEYLRDATESGFFVQRNQGHVLIIDPACLPAYHRLLTIQAAETLATNPHGQVNVNALEGNLREFVQTQIDLQTYQGRYAAFEVPAWGDDSEVQLMGILHIIIKADFGQVRLILSPLFHGPQPPPIQRNESIRGGTGGASPTVAFGNERFATRRNLNFSLTEIIPSSNPDDAFAIYSGMIQQVITRFREEADAAFLKTIQPVKQLTARSLQLNGLDLAGVKRGDPLPPEIIRFVRDGGGQLHLFDQEDSYSREPVPDYLREMVSNGTVVDAFIKCQIMRPGIVGIMLDIQIPLE